MWGGVNGDERKQNRRIKKSPLFQRRI